MHLEMSLKILFGTECFGTLRTLVRLDLLLLAVTQHMPSQLGFPAITGIADLAGEALCTYVYLEMLRVVLPFSKGLGTERACKEFRFF